MALTSRGLGQVFLGIVALVLALCLLACQEDMGEGPRLAEKAATPTESQPAPTSTPLPSPTTASPPPSPTSTVAPTPGEGPRLAEKAATPTESQPAPTSTPLPTPTTASPPSSPTSTVAPSPTPTEDPLVNIPGQPGISTNRDRTSGFINEAYFPCGPFLGQREPFPHQFVFWTPDSSQLVFSGNGTIWKVDAEGSHLQMVLDANPGASFGRHEFLYGFHADLSPDGDQLVYSSCQFPTEYERPNRDILVRDGPEFYERGKYHYEIALSGLDGANQQRLTHNQRLDHYPVWSPNGERIAFVSNSGNRRNLDLRAQELYTMSAGGSDVKVIAFFRLMGVALSPRVWSPDGQRLAFVVNEGARSALLRILYIVGHDGSGLVRIGETTGTPTWSPDGERLAFVSGNSWKSIIHTVRFDGTDLRQVLSIGPVDFSLAISQVSWSPDRSEILFVSDGIYTVGLDGKGLLGLDVAGRPGRAAWSPDGSRVAIYYPSTIYYPGKFYPPRVYSGNLRYKGVRLLTVARDGTDLRVLVEEDSEGGFHAWNPPPS